jgi:phospholipid/cholesterol/gamma-HCH transport system substrate-binding protein
MTRRASAPTAPAARIVAALALAIAVVALVLVLASGSKYTIQAQFTYSGQLVDGGLVTVAGQPIGSVSNIGVTPNGLADVTLSITNGAYVPLHVGTRAQIRAVGQAGVANRYVELTPGPPTAPAIPNGGVLSTTYTTSIVDLDALLDSFGPAQRANLDGLIADSAQVYAGSGAPTFAEMLGRLDPAVGQLGRLTGDLASTAPAIRQIIRGGASAAAAIASRQADLEAALDHTASALHALAGERSELADAIGRAPAVLEQSGQTLANATSALTALKPTLKNLITAAPSVHTLLGNINATLPKATPVVAKLTSLAPGLRSSLAGLIPLATPAVHALDSASTAFGSADQIVTGARYYGSDLILGILDGLVGAGAYNYSRWGHYVRLDFVQPAQTIIAGAGSNLLSTRALLPGVLSIRTKLLRRCPGGNVPPAIDGSTPWVIPGLCTASQDMPASVNTP